MDASSSTANRCHVQGYAPSMKFIRAGNLEKAKEPQHHHTNLVDKAVKSEISWLQFQRNLNAIKKDEDKIMKKIRLLRLSGGGASGITTAMEENNLRTENEKDKQTDREQRENRVLADLRKLISSRRVVNVDETPSGSNLKGEVVPLKKQFGGKHELKRSKQQEKNAVIQTDDKLDENDEILKPATIRTEIDVDMSVNDSAPSMSNLKGKKNLPKSKSSLKCEKGGRFKRNKHKKGGRFTRKKSRKG